jgi:hypothetical protein
MACERVICGFIRKASGSEVIGMLWQPEPINYRLSSDKSREAFLREAGKTGRTPVERSFITIVLPVIISRYPEGLRFV